jgi:hypothetical protein
MLLDNDRQGEKVGQAGVRLAILVFERMPGAGSPKIQSIFAEQWTSLLRHYLSRIAGSGLEMQHLLYCVRIPLNMDTQSTRI